MHIGVFDFSVSASLSSPCLLVIISVFFCCGTYSHISEKLLMLFYVVPQIRHTF